VQREAKYVTISSEALKLPIVVKSDNIGAMFMGQNASTGVRTSHVDIRNNFIRESIQNGILNLSS
jgi:hypothetical protein